MSELPDNIPPFVAAFRDRRARLRAADHFLEEELSDVCYVRLTDILPRFERQGGNAKQLWAALDRGPYVWRRESFDGGKIWIYHDPPRTEDRYDRMVKAVIERWQGEKES